MEQHIQHLNTLLNLSLLCGQHMLHTYVKQKVTNCQSEADNFHTIEKRTEKNDHTDVQMVAVATPAARVCQTRVRIPRGGRPGRPNPPGVTSPK